MLRYIDQRVRDGGRIQSLPEDATLYFLSSTQAPTRVFVTTPGVLAPGKMTDEFLEESNRSGVTDILWSSRSFPEYGVPQFGTDFDERIGSYIRDRFQQRGQIPARASEDGWRVQVWQRSKP